MNEAPSFGSSVPHRVHLVGAGGAGLSGAGLLLLARGHAVSGYDRAPSASLERLAAAGAQVHVGEPRPTLPADVELVVRSAAVPESDPDCAAAQARGVPVWKYARLAGVLTPPARTLAIAGTHGKTSTSWMLHHALRGLSEATGAGAPAPGALIGGACRLLGTNAVPSSEGGWFAIEACEYDRSFLQLAPAACAITNVEGDHLDYFGTLEAIQDAFARFVARVPPSGLVVVGRDVPGAVTFGARAPVWRLGEQIEVELAGERRGCFSFRLHGPGWATPPVDLALPGEFQVENAALALALVLGHAARGFCLRPEEAAPAVCAALSRFPGAERRFEPWGEHGGVHVVHDYAHHPTEVRATLEAARRALPDLPIIVLFQPHQHSRTARFLGEFVESLRGVDRVVVADIYGARSPLDARSARAEDLVVRLVRAGIDAEAPGGLSASLGALVRRLPPSCALLVLGAGDVDRIRSELEDHLAVRGASKRPPEW